MSALYGALSLALLIGYALYGHYWSDSVLLLFAAVIFSVHSGTERILNHLDGTKQETAHGRRRSNETKPNLKHRVQRTRS